MSQAALYGVGGTPTLFRKLVDRSITEVTAKDLAGLITIGNYCFYGCLLTKLELPDTIISIGERALASISITKTFPLFKCPPNCTAIGTYAFNYTFLKEAILSDNFTNSSNGYGQFASCSRLKKMVLSANLTNIPNIFMSYDNLDHIICRRRANGSTINPPNISNVEHLGASASTIFYTWLDSIQYYETYTNWITFAGQYAPLVETLAERDNLDTSAYTKCCVVGNEDYKLYEYSNNQWNEVTIL